MFFLRSMIRRQPLSVHEPMSPVWNQQSASMASAVLSAILK